MARVTVVWLLTTFVALFVFSRKQCVGCRFKNSNEIVETLKSHAQSQNGLIVAEKVFGKEFYLLAEGTWYGSGVWDQILFPKTKVVYEETGDSDGYWFVIIKRKKNELAIYAINQINIAWWPLHENLPKTAYRPQYLTVKKPRSELPFTIVKMDKTHLPIDQLR